MTDDEKMKELTKIAFETATTMLAKQARDFARTLSPEITGSEALHAFANAIEATNAKRYPPGTPS